MKKILALVLVLVAMAAGCGGDDDGSTTTTTTTTTPTTATTPTTEPSTPSITTTSQSTTSTSSSTSSTTSSTSTSTTSSTSTSTSTDRVVQVYFSTGDGTDCSEVTAFDRTVDASIGPASAAFGALVGGPTASEEAEGAFSFFSSATSDAVLSVTQSGGVLTVDLADVRADISNAGTSCGSAAFTSSLNATAFQFPTIDRVRYLFAGSCEEFGGFIQTDVCEFDRNS